MSVIPLLAASGTIFLDARAHKTIYDGCQVARARGAAVKRFRFEDPDHLDQLLRAERDPTRLVCMDGVNSMTGNAPDLPRLRGGRARARRAALRRRRARLRRHRRARPGRAVRPTARAATASSATPARATTTSSSSAGSRRPTRRCWPSSPARPRSRTCSRSPRRRTCTRARRRSPRWPRVLAGFDVNERRGDELRARAPRPHRARARLPARASASTPRTARASRSSRSRCATTGRIDAVGRLLFDRGVYVTLAAYPLVPQRRGRLPRAADRRQHRRRGRHADRGARGARRARRAAHGARRATSSTVARRCMTLRAALRAAAVAASTWPSGRSSRALYVVRAAVRRAAAR